MGDPWVLQLAGAVTQGGGGALVVLTSASAAAAPPAAAVLLLPALSRSSSTRALQTPQRQATPGEALAPAPPSAVSTVLLRPLPPAPLPKEGAAPPRVVGPPLSA